MVGYAASSLFTRDPAFSGPPNPWQLTFVPAPNPHSQRLAIGEYAEVGTSSEPTNWIVVLMAPDVRSLGLLAATTSGVRQPSIATSAGLAVAYAGVPFLAFAPELSQPASFYANSVGGAGQGSTREKYDSLPGGGPYAMLGRCYGPQPPRIQVDGHSVGTMVCDDDQHRLNVPHSALRGHGVVIVVRTSSLTSWQLAFGTSR